MTPTMKIPGAGYKAGSPKRLMHGCEEPVGYRAHQTHNAASTNANISAEVVATGGLYSTEFQIKQPATLASMNRSH